LERKGASAAAHKKKQNKKDNKTSSNFTRDCAYTFLCLRNAPVVVHLCTFLFFSLLLLCSNASNQGMNHVTVVSLIEEMGGT
jgi:hypothetical protein